MSGIVFFGTESLEAVVEFYVDRVGAERWLEQPDCTILQYDNMLFGFCDRDDAETDGTITFVVDSRADVDVAYDDLRDRAEAAPVENERYRIYQFFAPDPDGRTVEFQTFLHETEPV
ncbi:VOC family protein [Halovivax limisalsi]|uniref:VOC family protein n=1 Tax=Halovivax limisalsi TaxID=1453760 RepID=UPI001FFCE090|nr:VOC family protein [Halovivax limisalsi]